MAFNINDLRSQLTYGGAKYSLFQVQLNFPGSLGQTIAAAKAPFMIKAASLPASSLATIEVPYFGRRIKLAGDRSFEAWNVTVINDEDFLVRNALEDWSSSINAHIGNVSGFGTASPNEYKANASITQYSKTGQAVRRYEFRGLYPSDIAAVEMNWEADGIQEFGVTFQYDWWSVSGVNGTLATGSGSTQY